MTSEGSPVDDQNLPPLTVGPDGPDGPLRSATVSRATRRVLGIGLVLAIAAGFAVGAIGGSGRSAAAATFVGAALVSAVGAVTALAGAVRSEYRGQRVATRRIVVGVGLLLGAPILLILAAGAGGAA